MTRLDALARGLLAGVAGTAAMTAYQELLAGDGSDEEKSWEDAPAPAQVARRILKGVFGQDVSAERIPLLTNAMHWAYGIAWGGAYGLVQGTVRANPVLSGLVFGAGVWGMSYVQLVPMGLYEPPWEYPPRTLAKDLSYHLVYGLGVGAAFELVDSRSPPAATNASRSPRTRRVRRRSIGLTNGHASRRTATFFGSNPPSTVTAVASLAAELVDHRLEANANGPASPSSE